MVKPYIKVGTFSFGSEALQQKMAGFRVSIQDVGLRNITDTQVGLDFSLQYFFAEKGKLDCG